MVKPNKKLNVALFLFLAFSMQTQGRVVSHVEIKGIGEHDEGREDKNEIEACKVFRPSKNQIIRFFNQATESKENGNLLHEYHSPCISFATIKFKDGSKGDWQIQSSGLGFVIFDNGESATFFHKGNQWTDPYACTYGLGDDLIC